MCGREENMNMKCIVCKGTFSKNKFSKNQRRKKKKARKCVACIEEARERRLQSAEEARERRLQSAVVERIDMRKKMLATPLSPEEEAMLKKEKKEYKKAKFDRWEAITSAFGSSTRTWEFISFGMRCGCAGYELDNPFVSILPCNRPTMTTVVDEANDVFKMKIVDSKNRHYCSLTTEAKKPSGDIFVESRDSVTEYGKYADQWDWIDEHDPRTAEATHFENFNERITMEWFVIDDRLAADLEKKDWLGECADEYKTFFEKSKVQPGDILIRHDPNTNDREWCEWNFVARPVIPVPIASTKVLGKRKKRDEKDEVEVYYNGKWYVAKSVDRKKKKIVVRWKNGTVTEYEKTEFQSRKKERKKSSIPFWSIG